MLGHIYVHTDAIIVRTWMLHSHALVTQTLSSRRHGRCVHSHALVTQTLHGADMDALATRTHWSHGRYHRADMDALAIRTHWSHGRYMVRTWMLWQAIRANWSHGRYHLTDMDALAIRAHKSHGRHHRGHGHGCSGDLHAWSQVIVAQTWENSRRVGSAWLW